MYLHACSLNMRYMRYMRYEQKLHSRIPYRIIRPYMNSILQTPPQQIHYYSSYFQDCRVCSVMGPAGQRRLTTSVAGVVIVHTCVLETASENITHKLTCNHTRLNISMHAYNHTSYCTPPISWTPQLCV